MNAKFCHLYGWYVDIIDCNNQVTQEKSCFTSCYNEKDSPQPQVPVIFGLLNTNSDANLLSTKSISVPGK